MISQRVFDIIDMKRPLCTFEINFKCRKTIDTVIERLAKFMRCEIAPEPERITEALNGCAFAVTFPLGGRPIFHSKVKDPIPALGPIPFGEHGVLAEAHRSLSSAIRGRDDGITFIFTDNDTGKGFANMADPITDWMFCVYNEQGVNDLFGMVANDVHVDLTEFAEPFITLSQFVRTGETSSPVAERITRFDQVYRLEKTRDVLKFFSDVQGSHLNDITIHRGDGGKATQCYLAYRRALMGHHSGNEWMITYRDSAGWLVSEIINTEHEFFLTMDACCSVHILENGFVHSYTTME